MSSNLLQVPHSNPPPPNCPRRYEWWEAESERLQDEGLSKLSEEQRAGVLSAVESMCRDFIAKAEKEGAAE